MPFIPPINIEILMIKQHSLTLLQKALNQALALDDQFTSRLPPLQDKIIEVIITPLNVNFFITFDAMQLILLESSHRAPDTRIFSSPLGLIRLSLLPASKMRSLFHDGIRMEGESETGLALKQLINALDIDWEGHLAHFTGDVIAYQIGSLVRRGIAFTHQLGDSAERNLTDYLQEELQLLPPKEALQDFFKEIDTLSHDAERLQAYYQLLQAKSS